MTTDFDATTIGAEFLKRANRPPRENEVFFDGSMLWVHREAARPVGRWEMLGPSVDPGFHGLGKLQFEIIDGVLIEGSPTWVIQMILRAFYRLKEAEAKQLADLIFRIFKECGWKGPAESDNEAVPGTVLCEFEQSTRELSVEDIRPVLSQLQDPQFNGFLSLEQALKTIFVHIGRANAVEVIRDNDRVRVPTPERVSGPLNS